MTVIPDPRRIRLFAQITEIEADLRSLILGSIADGAGEKVFSADLRSSLEFRAAKDQYVNCSIADLLVYADLGDSIQIVHRYKSEIPDATRGLLGKHPDLLTRLIPIRNRVMHGRPLEFDDHEVTTNAVRHLVRADTLTWSRSALLQERIRSGNENLAAYQDRLPLPPSSKIHHNLPQADFDDTGFLGRVDLMEELHAAISGPYPVILLLGLGGVGKSSAALKYAYNLLDDEHNKFQSILWYSAKANTLTPFEITNLANKITDSYSLFDSVASDLAVGTGSLGEDAIISWLSTFPTLLIIDNLETVLDSRVSNFVRRIPAGSKILFTSRVGMPGYGFPINVRPLSSKESARYLRRSIQVWGLDSLSKIDGEETARLCAKLQHNPLFIKWFCQAVKSGQQPARILANPKIVLQFCVENVITHLDEDATLALQVLSYLSKPVDISTLMYVADLTPERVEVAIQSLIAHNIVTATPKVNIAEDTYEVSPLIFLYVRSYTKVSQDLQRSFHNRMQQLMRAGEQARFANAQTTVYSPDYYHIRGESVNTDVIAVQALRAAARAAKYGNVPDARSYCDQAEAVNPLYFEVYRVRGFVESVDRDFISADSNYMKAVSLETEHAPLRSFYAQFLLSEMNDPERALEQIDEAERLDPVNPWFKLLRIRALLFTHSYDEVDRIIGDISFENLRSREKYVYVDQCIQRLKRQLDSKWTEREFEGVRGLFVRLCEFVEDIDPVYVDAKTGSRLPSVLGLLDSFTKYDKDGSLGLGDLQERLFTAFTRVGVRPPRTTAPLEREVKLDRHQGEVRKVLADKGFGFLTYAGGDLFFHRRDFSTKEEFLSCRVGDAISFSLGQNEQGPTAVALERC